MADTRHHEMEGFSLGTPALVCRWRLAAGTLYGALSALCDKEWIRLLPVAEGSRKKEYILTEKGMRVLRNELARLRELVTSGDHILGGTENG